MKNTFKNNFNISLEKEKSYHVDTLIFRLIIIYSCFESVFRSKTHQNDIFLFFKKQVFLTLEHENDLKTLKILI